MNKSDIIYIFIFGGFFGAMFFIVEMLYLKFRLPTELTRKFLHFVIGVTCAIFAGYFQSQLSVLILGISFYSILTLGKRFNFMKCINAVNRKSYGDVIFPISIYLIFLLNRITNSPYFYFEISILVLSISDSVASVGGILIPANQQVIKQKNIIILSQTKTKLGSLFFLLSAAIIVYFGLIFSVESSSQILILYTITISVIATLIEAFSKNGWDNLFVPLSVWSVFILVEQLIL